MRDYNITIGQLNKTSFGIKVVPFDELSELQCFSDVEEICPTKRDVNEMTEFGSFSMDFVGNGYYNCYLTVRDYPLPKAHKRALVKEMEWQNFPTLCILLETDVDMASFSYKRFLENEINVCIPEFKRDIENKICPLLLYHVKKEKSNCLLKRIFNKV